MIPFIQSSTSGMKHRNGFKPQRHRLLVSDSSLNLFIHPIVHPLFLHFRPKERIFSGLYLNKQDKWKRLSDQMRNCTVTMGKRVAFSCNDDLFPAEPGGHPLWLTVTCQSSVISSYRITPVFTVNLL